MNPTQVATAIKEGIKTSEFYLTSFVGVCSAIVAIFPVSPSPVVKVAALVVAVASQLGYVASRTLVKTQ